jgi:hypothetical protein
MILFSFAKIFFISQRFALAIQSLLHYLHATPKQQMIFLLMFDEIKIV